jgi:hypothetical protein
MIRAMPALAVSIIIHSSNAAPKVPHPPALPEAAKAHFAALQRSWQTDSIWSEARDRALRRIIDPGDYQCGPTDFDSWIDTKFSAIQNFDAFIDVAFNYDAIDWATYYSLAFDNNADDDYIGVNGAQTQESKKRHKDLQRFWDVPTSDVLLQGMHGIDLSSDAKMVPLLIFLYGIDHDFAQWIVDYAQSVITTDPGLGYNHPIWTLNAFAFTARTEPDGSPFKSLPDKIVLGEGIITAMQEMGLGSNGPDYIHAHEFSHHVQFERGVFDASVSPDDQPAFTRMTELMADAFGSYFCAHSRGASFQLKRIVDAYRGAYVVGDCLFDNPGHHGTPNQRAKAAEWGAGMAQGAQKQGQINSSALMLQLFSDELPIIVAPDAP